MTERPFKAIMQAINAMEEKDTREEAAWRNLKDSASIVYHHVGRIKATQEIRQIIRPYFEEERNAAEQPTQQLP